MKGPLYALLIVAGLLTGCASAPADLDAWALRQGGCITNPADPRVVRVSQIGASLAAQTVGCPLRFHMLQNSSITAYTWPAGDVFVTAALVDHATDDEIAAAMAHELGHLLGDGHIATVVSLQGNPGPLDVEQRADLLGCQLLLATGRSPQAMIQTLAKVGAANPSCRPEIAQRIAALHQRFGG